MFMLALYSTLNVSILNLKKYLPGFNLIKNVHELSYPLKNVPYFHSYWMLDFTYKKSV